MPPPKNLPKNKLNTSSNAPLDDLAPLPDTQTLSPPMLPKNLPGLSDHESRHKEEIRVYNSPPLNKPAKKKEEEEENQKQKTGNDGVMVVSTYSDEHGKLLAYSISVDGEEGNVHDVSHLNLSRKAFMDELDATVEREKRGAAKDIEEGREPRNVFGETKNAIEAKYAGNELNMSFSDYMNRPITVNQDDSPEENTSLRSNP